MNTNQLKNLVAICASAALCSGLTSCGTRSVALRPAPGQAVIDATPKKEHRDRIKGMQIISVNGAATSRGESMIAAGINTVKVRYDWPQGGSQEVNLRFNARPNQPYFVKYDPFPPTADQFRGTTETSNAAQTLGDTAFGLMDQHGGELAGMIVLAPAIVLGTADYAHRISETIRENRQAAHYVDVMVISENNAEGVVRKVRAYPSGRVESKPWDAHSSAPERSSRSGTNLHNRQRTEVDADRFGGE